MRSSLFTFASTWIRLREISPSPSLRPAIDLVEKIITFSMVGISWSQLMMYRGSSSSSYTQLFSFLFSLLLSQVYGA